MAGGTSYSSHQWGDPVKDRRSSKLLAALALTGVIALVAGACAEDSNKTTPSAIGATPATVANALGNGPIQCRTIRTGLAAGNDFEWRLVH